VQCAFPAWVRTCPNCKILLVKELPLIAETADNPLYEDLVSMVKKNGGRLQIELTTTDVGKMKKEDALTVRSRRGEPLSVANAAVEDETGRVILVLWNEQIKRVTADDNIRVENGYVTSYRGITQLNVGRAGWLILLMQY
jgi:ssDNA-binding replication factor A large subunit